MTSSEKHEGHHHDHHHGEPNPAPPVRWIASPTEAWDEKSQSFSPRQEASTIELFFDLFFVANLATFTQYHAITNRETFWSYVAFFMILWTSWFHVVCFDTRFSHDSVWERACKTVHFCTFAGFALVGYKYTLFSSTTSHWSYRVLCWTLFISRFWLGIQYLLTTAFCSTRQNRHLRLIKPLSFNTLVFLVAGAAYGGLYGAFSDSKKDVTGAIAGLYVIIVLELVCALAISSIWTTLSFRATHIGERLGLLGLIIIGEGVIGTTKTIVRIMGKNGVYVEGCALIFCIIHILAFMWVLYFDNLPHYRFGAVKQQLWMILHLPLHLAILGVVEGSQHIALARYIYYSAEKFGTFVYYGCVRNHLDGPKLTKNLTDAIAYFKISDSAQGTLSLPFVYDQIYILGNQSGVCSPKNTSDPNNGMAGIPENFEQLFVRAIGSMFQAFNMDIPLEGKVKGLNVAARSWKVVYTYYWASILLLLICLTMSAALANRNTRFYLRYRLVAIIARGSMVCFSITVLVAGLMRDEFLNNYIGSSWILPTVTLKLWFVCMGDRVSKWLVNRRNRRDGLYKKVDPVDLEGERTVYSG